MHRPLTILGLAVVALGAGGCDAAARGARVSTTVYVGRHFEVRDHDQPVKYVFNADDRVARVTGSLSNRERVQRLRLQPGWNLVSLAVTATNFTGQLEHPASTPGLSALYQWRPATHDFAGVNAGQAVEAGTVLWLRSEIGAVVGVIGSYSEPAPGLLMAGGGYVGSACLEAASPQLPVGVTTWKYDTQAGTWQITFAGDLASAGDLPPTLAPGEAIFIHSDQAVELAAPGAAGRLFFYHPDHLGSTTALSDATGQEVEATAHYPFGAVRHQLRSHEIDAHYGFTQKEQDRESALHYFEARHVASGLGRFCSFDPLLQELESLEAGELKKLLSEPGRLNPFSYALNNPLRYVDPDGRESRDARQRPRARTPQRQPQAGQTARRTQPASPTKPQELGKDLVFRLGPPTKRRGELPASSFSISPRGGNGNPTSAGSTREPSLATVTEIQVTRPLDDATTSLFRAELGGHTFDSVKLIVPGYDGSEFRVEMENVIISSFSVSGHGGEDFENMTFNAGKVSFKNSSQPAPAQASREEWDFEPRRGQ